MAEEFEELFNIFIKIQSGDRDKLMELLNDIETMDIRKKKKIDRFFKKLIKKIYINNIYNNEDDNTSN